MRLRFPLVLLAALAAFVIPAGSAFASTATFVSPVPGATISQGQTFKVDTTGLLGVGDVLISSSTDGGVTTQFQSHCKSDGTPMLYNPAANASDIPCTNGSGVYKVNVAVGGWSNGPITFVALINNTQNQPLETITENVSIDNTVAPIVVTAFSPAASSRVSGTFTMSVTPSDQNNALTRVQYSTDGGGTYAALSPDGSGHYAKAIDTVATGIPNGEGALDVRVRIDDTAGNRYTHDYFYTLENPQVPTITPNTLVADKAQFRTAERQLEVGDLVEAYNMQATGFPAPTISYAWHFCPAGGGACYDKTGDSHGLLTISSSDVGATLTLIARATNASGSDSTTVGFGVIGPAYADPTPTPAPVDPTPEPFDPTPAPPVVTPPVVTPPVATPPVATPPVATPPAKKPVTKKKPKPTIAPKSGQASVPAKPAASTPAVPKTGAATPTAPKSTKRAPKTGHPTLPKKPGTVAPATPAPAASTPANAKPVTPTTATPKPTKRAPKTGHPTLPKKPVTTAPAAPSTPAPATKGGPAVTPQEQAAKKAAAAAVEPARLNLVHAQTALQSAQAAVTAAQGEVDWAQGLVDKKQAEINQKGSAATNADRSTLTYDKFLVKKWQDEVVARKALVPAKQQAVAAAQKAYDDAKATNARLNP